MKLACRQLPVTSCFCSIHFACFAGQRRQPMPLIPVTSCYHPSGLSFGQQTQQRRNYAIPTNDPPPPPPPEADGKKPDHPVWPVPPQKLTPYSIFNLQRRAAYTAEAKQTFYRLAKLYHPDGCHGAKGKDGRHIGKLSAQETIERFRLVVAAHDILSDPTKKSAYDSFGAGWAGAEGVIGRKEAANGGGRNSWRNNGGVYGHDTPFANATWEDWEAWYKRREKEANEQHGFDNYGFEHGNGNRKRETIVDDRTFFIILLLAFGTVTYSMHFSRLEKQQASLVEVRDRRNSEISRELNLLRREQAQLSSREQRVQNFLKVRDPQGMGYYPEEIREERLDRLLPPGEVCMSETIQKRNDSSE